MTKNTGDADGNVRDQVLKFRLSKIERSQFGKRAKQEGISLSEWLRDVALYEISQPLPERE